MTITTANGIYGNGLTFTCGRGTDVVLLAVRAMTFLVEKRNAGEIFKEFGKFWRELTSESQMRWVIFGFKFFFVLVINLIKKFLLKLDWTRKRGYSFGDCCNYKCFVGSMG